jgi:hypothetical protein
VTTSRGTNRWDTSRVGGRSRPPTPWTCMARTYSAMPRGCGRGAVNKRCPGGSTTWTRWRPCSSARDGPCRTGTPTGSPTRALPGCASCAAPRTGRGSSCSCARPSLWPPSSACPITPASCTARCTSGSRPTGGTYGNCRPTSCPPVSSTAPGVSTGPWPACGCPIPRPTPTTWLPGSGPSTGPATSTATGIRSSSAAAARPTAGCSTGCGRCAPPAVTARGPPGCSRGSTPGWYCGKRVVFPGT